jgi:HAD superfamily hydrolase (TIGR01509 family)
MAADGVVVSEAQFAASFGQRNDAILGAWLGPGASLERVRRLGEDKEAWFRRLVGVEGLAPLPGAVEWIERLARDGWRQAIASSAPRANVQVVVRALGVGAYLGALVAAEDVHRGKPEPEVFLVSASRVGVAPSRAVVVEDAAAGIEAARRAGMRSVGAGAAGLDAADVAVTSLTDLPRDTFERLVPPA